MHSSESERTTTAWDAVIVGAGPAGSATAITLAGFGWRVLLVEQRVYANLKLGESLPPASVGLVKHFLGDLDDPGRQPRCLYETVGNLSIWASEQVDVTDFYFTPTGHGLCLDRLAFDETLRSKAVTAGATLSKGECFEACERIADAPYNWRVTLAVGSQKHRHRSRYLVDCSGRRAVLAKALGIQPAQHDQLFAFAQWYTCAADDDRFTRIEAAPNGWWYSNRLPGPEDGETRRLIVFHTDKDLEEAGMAASGDGFQRLLKDSEHLARLLEENGYRPSGPIRGAPAGSQRLTDFCGDAWMAVGDAAQAYDPLSSLGIVKALDTGSHAGHMIHYALSAEPQSAEGLGGNNTYVRQYEDRQRELWQRYLSQLDHYYGMQPRWSDRPFWRRRRSDASADLTPSKH